MAEQKKRISTPTRRAAENKREVDRIRRKYKKNTAKRVKLLPSEVPHVEQMVVVLKLANYSRKDMARIIGISRDQVADILALPKINEEIAILREKIPAAALELLENYMIEAVMVLVDEMRSSGESRYRIQAAESVLDRGGVIKVSKQERVEKTEQTINVDTGGILDRLREASPEVQEQAAQAIEQLEQLLGQPGEGRVNEDG